MAFSGGSYDEVARWLKNFLTSHAKREHARIEIALDAGEEREEREGRSYGAWLVLGDRRSPLIELDYKDVADHRGSLDWCGALAERTRALARALAAPRAVREPRAR